jgi:hypothetical protein
MRVRRFDQPPSVTPHIATGLRLIGRNREGKCRNMIAVLEPPPQYVLPYAGTVVEMVLPLAQARALCGRRGAKADACSWTRNGKCYIVIPRNGPVKELASYRRHEIAHCNGWPAHR